MPTTSPPPSTTTSTSTSNIWCRGLFYECVRISVAAALVLRSHRLYAYFGGNVNSEYITIIKICTFAVSCELYGFAKPFSFYRKCKKNAVRLTIQATILRHYAYRAQFVPMIFNNGIYPTLLLVPLPQQALGYRTICRNKYKYIHGSSE